MDLSHGVLVAMLLAEIVIVTIGLADLRRRSEHHEGIQAATFLVLRRLDEFARSSRQSGSRPG